MHRRVCLSFVILYLRSALSAECAATFSAMQLVDGGDPHTRPISCQPTHFPFGPRYPGPPLVPHLATASAEAARLTKITRVAGTIYRIGAGFERCGGSAEKQLSCLIADNVSFF